MNRPRRWRMRRWVRYACAGGLLSAGAPLGLLALRVARRRHRWDLRAVRRAISEARQDAPDYLYVGASTAVAFSLFGFIVGRQADQLAALSRTDALTGLSNARELFERVDAELSRSRRRGEPLAMLIIDLDGLKAINDRYGHRAGDEALRSLADVIRSQLRVTDVGARWGGDEFAIFAPNTSAPAAVALGERIRALILQERGEWPLSGSIGVACVDPSMQRLPMSAQALMDVADVALYEAKRRGRNTVVLAAGPQSFPHSGEIPHK